MNIYEKINAIMESVESLQKDGKVAFNTTKYNYLSESKTTAEMRKQLVKHKLVILPIGVSEEVKGQITQGKYTYKLVNAENPEEFVILESGGQGHDSADKGSGKASSYAYKYLMWRTFAIPSNDDPDQISSDEIKARADKEAQEKSDKEAEEVGKEKVTAVAIKALNDLFEKTGEKFDPKRYKNVSKIEDLTKDDYFDYVAFLRGELEKKKAKK